jgi:hypothetical protein
MLEVQHVSARPKIAHGKCMAECVGAESNAANSGTLAEQFHIPSYVTLPCACAVECWEYEVGIGLLPPPIQNLPALERKRNYSMFTSFADDFQHQVVHVYPVPGQAQRLRDP